MATKTKTPAAAPPGGLTPLEYLALHIAGKDAKKWRDLVPVGKGRAVDLTVRIHGFVDVADDQTATEREKPDTVELLARVLHQLGPKTRATVLFALRSREPAELPADVVALAQANVDALTIKSEQTKRGNASGRLEICRR